MLDYVLSYRVQNINIRKVEITAAFMIRNLFIGKDPNGKLT